MDERTNSDRPSIPGTLGPRWGRMAGWVVAKVIWNTEVTGIENVPRTGPVILAANHVGVLDGPLMIGTAPRPVHIMVKEEMFRGFSGLFFRAAGQIPVDREGGRGALQAALGVLKRGGVVGVFPEGNRGRGDATSARAGVAWLALNAHAPVVPVSVLGTRRTGESVSHVPAPRRRLAIEFGTPIVLGKAPGVSGRVANAAANEAIRAALAELVTAASARTGLLLPLDGPRSAGRARPA